MNRGHGGRLTIGAIGLCLTLTTACSSEPSPPTADSTEPAAAAAAATTTTLASPTLDPAITTSENRVSTVPVDVADIVFTVRFLPADTDVVIAVDAHNFAAQGSSAPLLLRIERFDAGSWLHVGDICYGGRNAIGKGRLPGGDCEVPAVFVAFPVGTTIQLSGTFSDLPAGRYRATERSPSADHSSPGTDFDGTPRPPADLTDVTAPGDQAVSAGADLLTTVAAFDPITGGTEVSVVAINQTGKAIVQHPQHFVVQRKQSGAWSNVGWIPAVCDGVFWTDPIRCDATIALSRLTSGTYRAVVPVPADSGLTQASPEIVVE